MPELAEVEFYRKQWNGGLGEMICSVHLHSNKRIFRGTDTRLITTTLTGSKLLHSETHGKQMLFQFSRGGWLGIHLGMTGKLRTEKFSRAEKFAPAKHDHLALLQKERALVFSDPRQFGRVLFHFSEEAPAWWSDLPPQLLSEQFTVKHLNDFLRRHGKTPIKAVLLMQEAFPGIGNWMADEILWRSKMHPSIQAREIVGKAVSVLMESIRFVAKEALEKIGHDFSDPPKTWLFQHRWRKGGICPRCKSGLKHTVVGGRTTCWCPKCQPRKV
jgi:formamidopyrimidine-DNA glycosylase